MFTKEEAQFILEAIAAKPIQTNVSNIAKGLKLSPMVVAIIGKLNQVINPKPQMENEEVAAEEVAVEETPVSEEVSLAVEAESAEIAEPVAEEAPVESAE